MSPLRSAPPRCRRFAHSSAGFTLVELSVVVCIISVLAALGMPAFKKATTTARASTVANDLRVFATAFQTYAQQAGTFPAEAAIGAMPVGMDTYLRSSTWLRTTPIGGSYNWDFNQKHGSVVYKAAIGLRTNGTNKVMTDNSQLLAIDRRIDDGNLTTGNFFLGAGNEPVYIIER